MTFQRLPPGEGIEDAFRKVLRAEGAPINGPDAAGRREKILEARAAAP